MSVKGILQHKCKIQTAYTYSAVLASLYFYSLLLFSFNEIVTTGSRSLTVGVTLC